MKGRYVADTDTLYIELYAFGRLCAITIEHADHRMDTPAFPYERAT